MNSAQLTAINTILDKFKEVDIDQKITTFYANKDIDTVVIGQFSVPKFISTIKRVLKQLGPEIAENGQYLPMQFNDQTELGANNLQNDLNTLLSNLSTAVLNQTHINNALASLNKLVYYQVKYGFWDKSNKKLHKSDEIKINELHDQLGYIAEQLKKDAEAIKTSIRSLDTEKTNLSLFTKQKQQDLQLIANNLQTTNSTTQQINTLFTTSTGTNEKINSILQQQQANFDSQKKKSEEQVKVFEGQKTAYNTLEKTIKEQIASLDKQIAEYTTHLEFVEGKTEYFNERNNYLENLIGREAGASLFETFKARKDELNKPVSSWLKIVIGASLLTFIAILAIFTNLFGWLGEIPTLTWQNALTNTLKSSPFFFLLFYSISQYNKERHYQEEYAFKSAVALTIKAYADIIDSSETKDELIMKSITEVYKTPHPESKKMNKADKSVFETATDLVGDALDLLKKKG